MPSKHIYLTDHNYNQLKQESNMSSLINDLLEDYFSKKAKGSKKEISEEIKEIEELKKVIEIKEKEIEKVEEEVKGNEEERKAKLEARIKSIIDLAKDVYEVKITREEALKYMQASDKDSNYNLYSFLADEHKVSIQADL